MRLPTFESLPKAFNPDTATVSRAEWERVTEYVQSLERTVKTLADQLRRIHTEFDEVKLEHVRLKNNLASTAKIVEEMYENQNS